MSNKKKVDNIINYDNYILTSRESKIYFLLTGTALFIIGYVFYMNLYISIGTAVLTLPLKRVYISIRINKRRECLRQQFRDLLYSLSSSVSAGRQMSEAITESRDNLVHMYGENEPIMVELAHMNRCIQESRMTEEFLLRDFAYRSGIEEIINFADVYSTCKTTGADISSMISKASEVLIEKMSIEREIKAITAQKKAEAKIISLMPVIIIVFLNVVSPDYLHNLYHTVLGRLVMTAALAGIAISYYIMKKIVEVSI